MAENDVRRWTGKKSIEQRTSFQIMQYPGMMADRLDGI